MGLDFHVLSTKKRKRSKQEDRRKTSKWQLENPSCAALARAQLSLLVPEPSRLCRTDSRISQRKELLIRDAWVSKIHEHIRVLRNAPPIQSQELEKYFCS